MSENVPATSLAPSGDSTEKPRLPAEEEHARLILEQMDMLRRMAIRLTRSHVDAEDLVQETVRRALGARESFTVGTNVGAWLVTIMKNQHSTSWRKKRREVEDVDGAHSAGLRVEADEGGAEESRERVAAAMAALPEEQRTVLQMLLAGKQYDAIARELGVEEGTVKSRAHRARARLMTLLNPDSVREQAEPTGLIHNRRDSAVEIRIDRENPTIRHFDVTTFPPVKYETEPGEKPRQCWLRIDELCIDERYQRSVLRVGYKNIQGIARRFDWRKFTPVIVARWEGRYYVVDGQHRTYGALLRGLSEVPCMVFDAPPSVAAEAFAAINESVTRIHKLQVFGARVAAGDPEAVAINSACREVGVEIKHYPVALMKMKPNQTQALRALLAGHERLGRQGLQLALRMLMTAHPGERCVLVPQLIKAACYVVEVSTATDEQLMRAARGVSFTGAWREIGVKGNLNGEVLRRITRRIESDAG